MSGSVRGETPLHRGDKDKSNRKKLEGRLGPTGEEGYERPAIQTGPQCHLCVSKMRIDIDIDNIHLAERERSGYKKWRRNSEERTYIRYLYFWKKWNSLKT